MSFIGRTSLAFAIFLGFSAPALARMPTKPVVELFTSQGCSSCPPADSYMGELVKRRDIIALTFNVDYWDYLGWRDTLGRPEYSQRQRGYAHNRGDGRVYTPQIVVNGRAHAVGSHRRNVSGLIRAAASDAAARPLITTENTGGTLIIKIGKSAKPLARNATIYVAGIVPRVEVAIRRGENRGSKITYYNVVRKLMAVGTWTGANTQIRVDPRMVMGGPIKSCAILVQSGEAGPIQAAAWIEDQ